jgi:hypothetical protein
MKHKKYQKIQMIIFISFICMNLSLTLYSTVTKKASDVFKKWTEWQHVYHADCNLEELITFIKTDDFVKAFERNYRSSLELFLSNRDFLGNITDGHVNSYGFSFLSPISPKFVENISDAYRFVFKNMPDFIIFLDKNGFNPPSNIPVKDLIDRNIQIARLLFSHIDLDKEQELLFTVSNHFFNYCFSKETFSGFQNILFTPEYYPTAKFLYSVIWYVLAGNGWKNWSKEALDLLKEKTKDGGKIIYIAGGSDIYQMVLNGVFRDSSKRVNVINIDPQLPSQPKYYIDEWEWLVKGNDLSGGIGDKIVFNVNNKRLFMERISFQESGEKFNIRLNTGEQAEIPKSRTVWNIYDDSKNNLGSYTLERRLITQKDFEQEQGKVFLISFNELFFIAQPDFNNGWGINVTKLPEDFSIVTKQLAIPVTKEVLYNLHIASLITLNDFKFIALGTCIN